MTSSGREFQESTTRAVKLFLHISRKFLFLYNFLLFFLPGLSANVRKSGGYTSVLSSLSFSTLKPVSCLLCSVFLPEMPALLLLIFVDSFFLYNPLSFLYIFFVSFLTYSYLYPSSDRVSTQGCNNPKLVLQVFYTVLTFLPYLY